MTQVSTGTEDRKTHLASAVATTAEKSRRPGRRLFGTGDTPKPHGGVVAEQAVPGAAPEADMWEEGSAAARSGNHERAVACFTREAETRSRQGSHGRAAIAFRTAAEQARLQGLTEESNQLLSSAATAYVQAAERNKLTPHTAHQAWVSAAKCFLQLQHLDRAQWCIEEARKLADSTRSVGESVKTAT